MSSSPGQVSYPSLNGKTAVVTGASKNLGRSIAVALGEVGMNVGVSARSDVEGCEQTVAAVEAAGGKATYVLGDLGNPSDIEGIIDGVREDFGPIEVLVNNAAIRPKRNFEDITLDDWQQVIDVNLRSAFLTVQNVLPDMREAGSGAIINVLGQMALQGRRNKAHVSATKSGLIGLTMTEAAELGPEGIRANGIVPGRKIKTDREESENEKLQATFKKVEQATPMRRRGDPAEIANAIRFLVSDQASYINGQVINVDGGLNPVIDIENIGSS
jgi:3-oxoacyl-[acyl-carrier protein] reductase